MPAFFIRACYLDHTFPLTFLASLPMCCKQSEACRFVYPDREQRT